jgi:hypothetical protein
MCNSQEVRNNDVQGRVKGRRMHALGCGGNREITTKKTKRGGQKEARKEESESRVSRK